MPKKPTDAPVRRVRELPPETRREVERAKANIAVEKVKISDSKAKVEEHQALIDRLMEK